MEVLTAYTSQRNKTDGAYRDMTIEDLYCLIEKEVKKIYQEDDAV